MNQRRWKGDQGPGRQGCAYTVHVLRGPHALQASTPYLRTGRHGHEAPHCGKEGTKSMGLGARCQVPGAKRAKKSCSSKLSRRRPQRLVVTLVFDVSSPLPPSHRHCLSHLDTPPESADPGRFGLISVRQPRESFNLLSAPFPLDGPPTVWFGYLRLPHHDPASLRPRLSPIDLALPRSRRLHEPRPTHPPTD